MSLIYEWRNGVDRNAGDRIQSRVLVFEGKRCICVAHAIGFRYKLPIESNVIQNCHEIRAREDPSGGKDSTREVNLNED